MYIESGVIKQMPGTEPFFRLRIGMIEDKAFPQHDKGFYEIKDSGNSDCRRIGGDCCRNCCFFSADAKFRKLPESGGASFLRAELFQGSCRPFDCTCEKS